MPLLTLANAQLAYGELPLLDRASFAMEPGERIGSIEKLLHEKLERWEALEARAGV